MRGFPCAGCYRALTQVGHGDRVWFLPGWRVEGV